MTSDKKKKKKTIPTMCPCIDVSVYLTDNKELI